MVSNWEPAHSLVEEPSLGPRLPFAFWLWLLPTCLSASSWGRGPVCSQLALLWYSLNPLFCEWARLCLRLELFAGKFSLSFFSLWLSHSLGCYLTVSSLRLSSGHSGLVLTLSMQPTLPCPASAQWWQIQGSVGSCG